jgi:dihydropteroate synthase
MSKISAYKFGSQFISFDAPKVMGILNVTPDSFSDGGKYFSENSAVDYALNMIDDGADIIDIGGESTRPGSNPVSLEDELQRTIPVIKRLVEIKKSLIISIDTTKREVARQALDSGASIVNDISGLTSDEKMIDVVKSYNAGIIIMHIKGNPKTMQENPNYLDVVNEVKDFLFQQSYKAKQNGIDKIIIDPGIGFGKRVEDNFELIKNLEKFQSIGFPVMMGLSRKSFLGKILDLNVNDRDVATVIMETASVLKSARIIRTHNVKYCTQMVKLVSHILQAND